MKLRLQAATLLLAAGLAAPVVAQEPTADLRLTKTDVADPVLAIVPVTYLLTVENLGPATAENVVLADTLAASVVFEFAIPTQGTCARDGRVVRCDLGDLAAGSSATVELQVTSGRPSDRPIDTALVVSNTADPNGFDNGDAEQSTFNNFFFPNANLVVTQTDSPDPVTAGETLTYTVSVRNVSLFAAAPDLTLTDVLPDDVTVEEVSPSQGTCDRDGRIVFCELGRLAPDSIAVVVFTVTPQVAGRTLTNSAMATAERLDTIGDDNVSIETTTVGSGGASTDLTLVKTADFPLGASIGPGEVVVYTLTVTTGAAAASEVLLVDSLPPTFELVSVTPDQGTCFADGRVVACELGSLGPAASVQVVIEARGTEPGGFLNTATVSAREGDLNPTDNGDTPETTFVAFDPDAVTDLSITKTGPVATTGPPGPVEAGNPLTYTLTARNAGPSDATGVTVTDLVTPWATVRSASPSQGTCAFEAGVPICRLGALAAGAEATVELTVTPSRAGTLLNTAAVSANESDPTLDDNTTAVTVFVTASEDPLGIPTLSDAAVLSFILLLAACGVLVMKR